MKAARAAAVLTALILCASCTRGEQGESLLPEESETAEETAVFYPYDKTQPEVVCRVIRESGEDGGERTFYEIISPERSRGIRFPSE